MEQERKILNVVKFDDIFCKYQIQIVASKKLVNIFHDCFWHDIN